MKTEKDKIRFARFMEHLDRQYERLERRKSHLRKRFNVTEDEEKEIRKAIYDSLIDKQ